MTNSTEYKYDAFISYSHGDQDWVRDTLLPTLEQNGINAIIDYRDFEAGAPSITEMERAVKESRKTILVLTPNYIKSSWSEFELALAGTLDPAGRERRILPILLEKCEIPLRIKYLTYLNFSDPATLNFQWKKLFSAFNKKARQIPVRQIVQPQRLKKKNIPGISSMDLQKLRKALMSCDELTTDARLQALFSDPRLSAFRLSLPEASSLAERADLLGAFLISRKFSSGESLLDVFLMVLREKIPVDDARLQSIQELISSLGI